MLIIDCVCLSACVFDIITMTSDVIKGAGWGMCDTAGAMRFIRCLKVISMKLPWISMIKEPGFEELANK